MPVTLTAAKTKTKAVHKAQLPAEGVELGDMSIEDLADRYGDLEDRLNALKMDPLFAQFSEVDKELKKRLEAYGEKDIVTINGKHWIVEAGACSKAPRQITDVLKVMKFVGTNAFAEIAKVGVSDAEKYLTPDQFSEVVSEEKYTKNRKIVAKYLG